MLEKKAENRLMDTGSMANALREVEHKFAGQHRLKEFADTDGDVPVVELSAGAELVLDLDFYIRS